MKLTALGPHVLSNGDTLVLTISLSAGFLDSLHDPLAYVAPHDIPDAAVPVNENAVTPPPPRILSESRM